AMDCLVFPSLYEGLPLVLIEAQCAGLKVLASDRISQESCVTNNILYMSLKKKPEDWAKAVLEFRSYKRADESDNIRYNGFSITETVKVLQQIYTDK
ncbi:MAG: glycosyltransferase, partial [Odoribacter sp.]|nr:glycosyltransferase [Odoribacter sp.]